MRKQQILVILLIINIIGILNLLPGKYFILFGVIHIGPVLSYMIYLSFIIATLVLIYNIIRNAKDIWKYTFIYCGIIALLSLGNIIGYMFVEDELYFIFKPIIENSALLTYYYFTINVLAILNNSAIIALSD